MTSVLIVDDDKEFGAAIGRMLRAKQFEVRLATSYDDAVDQLGKSAFDVLLADLRLRGRDGLSLIEQAQRIHRAIAPILMSAYATARDYEAATNLGAVAVLNKPFTPKELQTALDRAVEGSAGFRGNIHGLSLVDMFQMFNMSRRTVTIMLGGDPPAKVHFLEGEIVHCERGDAIGESALRVVFDSRSGSIRTTRYAGGERTISRSFHELLLDTLRAVDEGSRDIPTPPDSSDDLDRAFRESKSGLPAPVSELPGAPSIPLLPEPVSHVGNGASSPGLNPRLELLSIERFLASDPAHPRTADLLPPDEFFAPEELGILPHRPKRPFDMVCRALASEIQGTVSAALLDLDNGELLGWHGEGELGDPLRALITAARGVFRAPGVGAGELEELQLATQPMLHLVKAVKNGRVALVVSLPSRVGPEKAWAELRALVRGLEANLRY